MSDQNANLKGYSYQEMSSKVEQADRSLLRSRAHEPTGEVESLRGRNDVGRMGDRLSAGGTGQGQKHTRPSELLRDQQKKKKAKKQQQQPDDHHSRRSDNVAVSSGGQSILDLDNLMGYQPTTQTARAAYETILVRRGFESSDHAIQRLTVKNPHDVSTFLEIFPYLTLIVILPLSI
jgi:pre-mRNA-splicing helicase BRR2